MTSISIKDSIGCFRSLSGITKDYVREYFPQAKAFVKKIFKREVTDRSFSFSITDVFNEALTALKQDKDIREIGTRVFGVAKDICNYRHKVSNSLLEAPSFFQTVKVSITEKAKSYNKLLGRHPVVRRSALSGIFAGSSIASIASLFGLNATVPFLSSMLTNFSSLSGNVFERLFCTSSSYLGPSKGLPLVLFGKSVNFGVSAFGQLGSFLVSSVVFGAVVGGSFAKKWAEKEQEELELIEIKEESKILSLEAEKNYYLALDERDKLLKECEEELEEVNRQRFYFKNHLKDLQVEFFIKPKRIRDEIDKNRENFQKLQEEVKKAKDDRGELLTSIKEIRVSIQANRKEEKKLLQQLSDLKLKTKTEEYQIAFLQVKQVVLSQIDVVNNKLEKLRGKIASKSKCSQEQQEKVERLSQKHRRLCNEIKENEQQILELKDQLSCCKDEIELQMQEVKDQLERLSIKKQNLINKKYKSNFDVVFKELELNSSKQRLKKIKVNKAYEEVTSDDVLKKSALIGASGVFLTSLASTFIEASISYIGNIILC